MFWFPVSAHRLRWLHVRFQTTSMEPAAKHQLPYSLQHNERKVVLQQCHSSHCYSLLHMWQGLDSGSTYIPICQLDDPPSGPKVDTGEWAECCRRQLMHPDDERGKQVLTNTVHGVILSKSNQRTHSRKTDKTARYVSHVISLCIQNCVEAAGPMKNLFKLLVALGLRISAAIVAQQSKSLLDGHGERVFHSSETQHRAMMHKHDSHFLRKCFAPLGQLLHQLKRNGKAIPHLSRWPTPTPDHHFALCCPFDSSPSIRVPTHTMLSLHDITIHY